MPKSKEQIMTMQPGFAKALLTCCKFIDQYSLLHVLKGIDPVYPAIQHNAY